MLGSLSGLWKMDWICRRGKLMFDRGEKKDAEVLQNIKKEFDLKVLNLGGNMIK